MTVESLTAQIEQTRAAFDDLNTRRYNCVPEHIVKDPQGTIEDYPVLSPGEETAIVFFAEKISRLCRFRSLLLAKDYCAGGMVPN